MKHSIEKTLSLQQQMAVIKSTHDFTHYYSNRLTSNNTTQYTLTMTLQI